MATTYPTTKQTFINPINSDFLNDPNHANQHADKNDTIEAIEDRLGTGSDITPGATGKILNSTSATATEWTATPTITTSLTVSLVIGGTTTTSDLTLQTTSGIGAAGADMHFLVGNNGATEAMTILNSGNVGIGTTPTQRLDINGITTFGGGNGYIRHDDAGVFHLQAGASGYAFNNNGNNIALVRILDGGNVGIGTTSPTNLLSLGGNSARIFWMERHTTANTAGNTLTITAGGATAAATDKAGGALILQGGLSTGSAESGVTIQGCVAGASGTADRTQTTMVQVLGNKIGIFNTTPVVQQNTIADADGTLADITTKFNTLLASLEAYGWLKSV